MLSPRRSSAAQTMPLLTISIRPTVKVPRILLIRVCTFQRAPFGSNQIQQHLLSFCVHFNVTTYLNYRTSHNTSGKSEKFQ